MLNLEGVKVKKYASHHKKSDFYDVCIHVYMFASGPAAQITFYGDQFKKLDGRKIIPYIFEDKLALKVNDDEGYKVCIAGRQVAEVRQIRSANRDMIGICANHAGYYDLNYDLQNDVYYLEFARIKGRTRRGCNKWY